MKRAHITWRWCLGGSRFCFRSLRVFLIALALLQIAVAGLILFREELRIPEAVGHWLGDRLRSRGIEAQWNRLRVDVTGRIFIDRPDLRNAATGETLFRADALYAELSLFNLFVSGRLPLHALRIESGALYLPSMVSASGTNAPAVTDLQLSLELDRSTLELGHLRARCGPVQLAAQGQLRIPEAGEEPIEPPDPAETPSWIDAYYTAAARLAELERLLRHAEAGEVVIAFATTPDRRTKAAVELCATRLFLPGDLVLEDIRGTASIRDLEARSLAGPVEIRAARAVREATLEARRLEARLSGASIEAGPLRLPRELRASAASAEVYAVAVSAPRIWCDLGALDRPSIAFRLLAAGQPVSGRIEPRLGERAGVIEFVSRANPVDFFTHPTIAEMKQLRQTVRSLRAIDLSGRARFAPGLRFEEVAFGGRIDDLDILGSNFRHVRFQGHANPDRLLMHMIEVELPDQQHARGAFVQHFHPADYRILASGAIHPPILHPILGPWWHRLWEDMDTTPGHPAAASVDVIGRWGAPELTEAIVRARTRHAVYAGVPADRVTVQVRHLPGFVSIDPLTAWAGDGSLRGSVLQLYPRDRTRGTINRYDLESTLDFESLCALIGSAGEGIREVLGAEGHPQVRIAGSSERIPGTDDTVEDLRLEIAADAPLHLGRFPFEWARVKATLREGRLALDPLEVGFLGGLGSGTVTLEAVAEADSPATFDLAFTGVNFQQLGRLLDPGEDEATEVGPQGRIALEAKGRAARRDQIKSWTADGTVRIEETELHRLQLFGPLSRLLESIGLGFTSFSLDRFTGEVQLENGLARLREVNIDGPAARIEADGSYAVEPKTLDFDLKLFLLDPEEASLTSVFGLLLRPLGHILELRMTGTFEDPNWRFRYDPRNLLPFSNPSEGEGSSAAPPAGPALDWPGSPPAP